MEVNINQLIIEDKDVRDFWLDYMHEWWEYEKSPEGQEARKLETAQIIEDATQLLWKHSPKKHKKDIAARIKYHETIVREWDQRISNLVNNLPPMSSEDADFHIWLLQEFGKGEEYKFHKKEIKRYSFYLVKAKGGKAAQQDFGLLISQAKTASMLHVLEACGIEHKKGKAKCPFHEERTSSFSVNPRTNKWKCFGCGEGGDAIDFIEKHQKVEFKEAVKYLISLI